jgi:hypothetical protein
MPRVASSAGPSLNSRLDEIKRQTVGMKLESGSMTWPIVYLQQRSICWRRTSLAPVAFIYLLSSIATTAAREYVYGRPYPLHLPQSPRLGVVGRGETVFAQKRLPQANGNVNLTSTTTVTLDSHNLTSSQRTNVTATLHSQVLGTLVALSK